MIIGTAGHIDLGKTRLIKALKGADRHGCRLLPEEKARGSTAGRRWRSQLRPPRFA